MKKAISVLLVFCVLFALPSGAWADPAKKKPKKTVKQLKSKLSTVNSQKKDLKNQIRAKQKVAGAVIRDIVLVDNDLEKLVGNLDKTLDKLAECRKEQKRLTQELTAQEAKLAAKRDQLRKRLKRMYMHREEAPVLALITSKDLGELGARESLMKRIAAKDRELFEEVRALTAQVAKRKARQDQLVKDVSALKVKLQAEQDELEKVRAEKKAALAQLHAQANALRRKYDELDRESDQIAAQIQAFQVSSGGRYTGSFGGRFMKPAAGRISSGFGYRFHPILKQKRLHAGIDIAGGSGSPIFAAAEGVVIYAGYRGGYGNAVVIDHGSGISTLYGHCSRLYVRSGQKVGRGQRIAAIGSTGLSTGPHLHFEVRKNGRPVNPAGRF